jgi:hypothetical protein
MDYNELTDERIIEVAIDFIKHNQTMPSVIVLRLESMGMADILNPCGELSNDPVS